MYEIEYTGLFKRKVKLLKKRGYDLRCLSLLSTNLKKQVRTNLFMVQGNFNRSIIANRLNDF